MTVEPTDFSDFDIHAVLDTLPVGVIIANVDGRIVFWNAMADRYLGVVSVIDISPAEWVEHYGACLPDGSASFPDDEYPLIRALAGEHTRDVEMMIRNAQMPDAAIVAMSSQPLFDKDGDITGAAAVFRDVTTLRRAERLRDDLTAFLVHDLKNPLSAILSTCDLLLLPSPPDEDMRADILAIQESGQRLQRMVMDLLDIQMAEDGALHLDMVPTPVGPLLSDLEKAARPRLRAREQRIQIDVQRTELSIMADREYLFRVLTNLIDNCAKYGPVGGLVRVDVVSTAGEDSTLICVSDEGPGVPPELSEKIFEKYTRAERAAGMRSRCAGGFSARRGSLLYRLDSVPGELGGHRLVN